MHNIQQVIKILKKGGIIVYPTDTAYAIGCKFRNKKGIKRILKIKKRKDQKFTLIASSLAQVNRYFELNTCQIKIAKKYWPGPVSIVVSPQFSIRVPKNNMARSLAKGANEPLIATSLNISGKPAIYDLKKINKNIFFKNIFVLDKGPLTKRKTSTIVQCSRKKIIIFRQGEISPRL